MSRRKINIFVILLSLLLLCIACNPKPVTNVDKKPKQSMYTIPNHEKLLDTDLSLFNNDSLLQGLQRMGAYLGADFNEGEKVKIYYDSNKQYISIIDFLQLMLSKGIPILPTYGTMEEVIEQIDRGHPVFVQYSLVGATEYEGLFYAYDDQSLYYYLLPTMSEKKIPMVTLNTLKKEDVKLFKYEENMDSLHSDYYYFLLNQDIYIKDDPELYKQVIKRIETENWLGAVPLSETLYMIYYTFYDVHPDKVAHLIERISEKQSQTFVYKEIAFINNIQSGNKDKAIEVMNSMNLTPEQLRSYRDITLYHIALISIENGATKTAAHAMEILSNRNPSYPGLNELFDKS